ncbi:MAG: adenine phosphoribosyltransferase [bacterium]|nr:adenine phosphoribosyltransferase [bacterium]
MDADSIEKAIRDIKDFPKPGILFKDITPVLQDGKLLSLIIDLMDRNYKVKPTKIIGIESRGFIFGTALAYKLGIGMVTVRKKGKLPYKTYEASYALEYGEATLEIHQDALEKGDRVVIVDDLLATGGTAEAAVKLVNKFDVEILGIEFLIELEALQGRKVLAGENVNTIIKY